MEAHFSLSHLYPVCQDVIVVVDAVSEFCNIRQPFLMQLAVVLITHETVYLIDHAVDKGQDAVDKLHFRPLLEIAFFVLSEVEPCYVSLLADFFVFFFFLIVFHGVALLPFL